MFLNDKNPSKGVFLFLGKSAIIGKTDKYKEAKEDYIKMVANRYKYVIDERLYTSLMNRPVDIDD